MPGQYGVETKTVRNLEIVDIRPEENLILVKGPLPGSRSGIVTINKVLFG
jgi:large subunit ribosomal protein L3